MTIFNSLGSNYDFNFVLKSIISQNNKKEAESLIDLLEGRYSGKTILFYKAREAIKTALLLTNLPKRSKVAITGFTCWAVYEAVKSAGFQVEYLDIDEDLNFSPVEFEERLKKTTIKAVIIQNTLGYPCEISQIEKICKERGIILIEDLAHSIGTSYVDKREAGTVGDFTILSFSQDKIIDGISGGALIVRNKKYVERKLPIQNELSLKNQLKDKSYPLLTYIIRNTYKVALGKVLHLFLKNLNLLSKPIENNSIKFHVLPNWYCFLIKLGFKKLTDNLEHRRRISYIYAQNLNNDFLSSTIVKHIPNSTNLRFPIFVKDRESLIACLKQKDIFISDIWYDAPVAPRRLLKLTDYKNQCHKAESISKKIINLPTHINITERYAKTICLNINKWTKSQ